MSYKEKVCGCVQESRLRVKSARWINGKNEDVIFLGRYKNLGPVGLERL